MYVNIRLDHDKKEYPFYKKGESSVYKVFGIYENNLEDDITNLPNVRVISMDYNTTIDEDNKTIFFDELGSSIVKAFYNNATTNTRLFYVEEFVCYETFLKENYLSHMVSQFEKEKIEQNTFLKTILDTCMEYMDILYAYNEDIFVMKDINKTKSKFLNFIGRSMGFENLDQESVNTVLEKQSQDIYRELLTNLIDLVNIRGTKNAYKLFFSVLGYDIKLEEFWFDENGDLIEINPDDFMVTEDNPIGQKLSTFFRYNTTGVVLDEPPVERNDPRKFASPNNDYNVNSKSNYVRPVISVRQDLGNNIQIDQPGSFSIEKRRIINRFLEYLRPSHIQYIRELIAYRNTEIFEVNFNEIFLTSKIRNRDGSVPGAPPGPADPNYFPWEDMIGDIYEQFQAYLGLLFYGDIQISYRWDTENIKWDDPSSVVRWDSKEVFFEDFLIEKI